MWVGNKLLPELEGFCVFLFRSEGGVEAELGKQICVESAVVLGVKLKLLIYISTLTVVSIE